MDSGFEFALERVVRTVLIVDVVESVRLMHDDEQGAIQRWRRFAATTVETIAPAHGGRLVKSLGDGLMLEFPAAPAAVQAAFALQQLSRASNDDLPEELKMHVRIGVHVSSLVADERDIYGHGVNLTARLTTLAGADEIVVSADVRDQLVHELDADVEDLGDCYLKHLSEPVRAFRIGPAGPSRALLLGSGARGFRATVAIIPFSSGGARSVESETTGQALADDVIVALSRSSELNVISRLSSTVFRGRKVTLELIARHLNADYVVSGSLSLDGPRLLLRAEMAETRSGQIVWSQSLSGLVRDAIVGKSELPGRIVRELCAAMMARELASTAGKGLATIESRTLLLSSITLMHRISPLALERAQLMLQALIDREPREPAPYAWLAKCHVLRVTQGWSTDVREDGRKALDQTRRALDRDPGLSLALTVEGQVNTYILKNLEVAEDCYEAALRENPNDSLAWLLKGTLHAFRDEGSEAVRHTRQALKLSPLDPLMYYFDSLAATAALAAHQYARALKLAQSSLRLNRAHASTWRVMITALCLLGREEEARSGADHLLKLDPTMRVSTYLERSPAAPYELARTVAAALQRVGVPP